MTAKRNQFVDLCRARIDHSSLFIRMNNRRADVRTATDGRCVAEHCCCLFDCSDDLLLIPGALDGSGRSFPSRASAQAQTSVPAHVRKSFALKLSPITSLMYSLTCRRVTGTT